jgi:hypothetical protein
VTRINRKQIRLAALELNRATRCTSVEFLDGNGKLVKRADWKVPWPALLDQLRQQAPFGVCFEASCGYGFLYEQVSAAAQQAKRRSQGFRPRTPAA